MNIRNGAPNKLKSQTTEKLAQEVRSQQKTKEFDIMTNPHMQFEFENGPIMAKMGTETLTRIGLDWHFQNTNGVDEFVESVSNFIQTTGETITSKDINRLKTEYNKA